MHRTRAAASLVVLAASAALPAQAPLRSKPAPLTPQQLQSIQAFRDHQTAILRSPMSALGMVALDRIPEGDMTIGSAPSSKIRLDHASALLGTVHRSGDTLTFTPGPASQPALTINGKPATAQPVSFDADGTSQKFVQGSVNFVLRHKDGYFIVARDTQAPELLAFHGLRWYAPDARYRVTAQWQPYPAPRTVRIVNRIGQVSNDPSYGVAQFTLNGHSYQLEPTIEQGANEPLFFVFRDLTSRTDTYQGGRFLNASMPDHGLSAPGTVVLDFNLARNPLCAFSEHTSCPLPPKQNQLNVTIPAGEKRYHD
ncbi:DUF1684 domain-containing protein [Terriglobus aquaticus]|uniref:DUF1684 domain-containing protein n=1 Tax=Terriglobus aquaticus TaxID=940139 RepID=A0ABW9KPB7_9BACT|nr:DUF1684 domain-containing protein [Terriglobus aquaticus]